MTIYRLNRLVTFQTSPDSSRNPMLLSLDVKCADHLIMTAIATSHKNLLNVLSTQSAHLTQGSLQNMAVSQITLTINLPI